MGQETNLAVATLLGGVAALWFFWDKIVAWWSAWRTPATPAEKWVDLNYPLDSGLQVRLESQGYKVGWCQDTKLSRKLDLEEWEVVIEPDGNGTPSKFRLRIGLPTRHWSRSVSTKHGSRPNVPVNPVASRASWRASVTRQFRVCKTWQSF